MAFKHVIAGGNYSTATTWGSEGNTPTIHVSTNLTLSGSNTTCVAFTAPNTTNACLGCYIFVVTVGAGNVTLTLRESGVDKSSETVASSSLVAGSWNFIRFTTPYTYTTTGSSAYDFKLTDTGSTVIAQSSTGSRFAYRAVDNRTGVPGTSDDIMVGGYITNAGRTNQTCTVDGTQTLGSNGGSGVPVAREVGVAAISVVAGGTFKYDIAANSQLTCKGSVAIYPGGEFDNGTVANPVPSGQTAKHIFSMSTSGGNGVAIFNGGKFIPQGNPRANIHTNYVSGVGTAADPMIVASDIGVVNDEVLITATNGSGQSEYRVIKAKNSLTSYVLSNTAGGAESALTYTHTSDAYVMNLQRNAIFTTDNTSRAFYIVSYSTVAGDVNCDWTRFEYIGALTGSDKEGFGISGASTVASIDNCVFYRPINMAIYRNLTKTSSTFTNLIVCGGTATGNQGIFGGSATMANNHYEDCWTVDCARVGFRAAGVGHTYTRCHSIDMNRTVGSVGCGFSLPAGRSKWYSCEAHLCGVQGVYIGGSHFADFYDCEFGNKGTNTIDITTVADTVPILMLENCLFDSATLLSGYTALGDGSEINFQKFNQIATSHRFYSPYGKAISTGAGLSDTTVRTTGSLGIALQPEDSTTGFTWSFQIPAVGNTTVNFQGFAQKNAAFGTDVCTINLYLPGSTTPDATANLSDTTGSYLPLILSAYYNSSISGLATVEIIAKSTTAGAYIYIDDLYNAGDTVTNYDKLAGLDIWHGGKPASIISPLFLGGIPGAVWAQSANNVIAGTMGELLQKAKRYAQTAMGLSA